MDDDEASQTFKILIATDCHLGFAEKDQIRGNDSLTTFKEILQIGKEHQVDFVLLGGDLFHENKPSRKTLHGTMALLREYCMGEKPCQVEFISDQSVNFASSRFPVVNYEDANYNVSMPVFSIHGNHDDPTGDGNLCSLDLLSVCGLVNYFGRATSIDDITISPLLMQKGQSKLALYGLGSIRDERLHRTFLAEKVKMLRPKEDEESWFNIFVLHQNRSKHGLTNYIPEKFLEDFLDLVIWGHEHECIIKPTRSVDTTLPFFITQPGSSIATSLCEGESKKKQVGILEIRGKNFRLKQIPLQTVRPFYMQQVVLADADLDHTQEDQVQEFLRDKVEDLILQASQEQTGHPGQPKKPLIRLKVDYSGGFTLFNTQRFGQKFVDRVANPRNLLLFHRKKVSALKDNRDTTNTGHEDAFSRPQPEALDTISMDDLIKEYLSSKENALNMNILTERRMAQALHEFVDKDDKDAISTVVKWQLNMTQNHLKRRNDLREEDIEQEVVKHTERARQREAAEEPDEHGEEIKKVLAESRASQESTSHSPEHNLSSGEEEAMPVRGRGRRGRGASASRSGEARGRGRGRGRGSRSGRGRAAASSNRTITESFKQKSKTTSKDTAHADQVLLSDSEDDDIPLSTSSRRDRGSTTARSSATRTSRNIIQLNESDDSDDPFSMEPSSKRQRK